MATGAVAQWRSGAVAQWRSGAVAQWCSGAVGRASDSQLRDPGLEPCSAVSNTCFLAALLQFSHRMNPYLAIR